MRRVDRAVLGRGPAPEHAAWAGGKAAGAPVSFTHVLLQEQALCPLL